jgi:subtilase family serine protease
MKDYINYTSKGGINRKYNVCKLNISREEMINCLFSIPEKNENKENKENNMLHNTNKNKNGFFKYFYNIKPFISNIDDDIKIIPNTINNIKPPYTPNQIRRAYDVPIVKPVSTRPVSVTIVTPYHNKYLLSDTKHFSNIFNNSEPYNIHIYNLGGNIFNPGWALENTIDVQWVLAINPNARINVVEARSSSYNDLLNSVAYANTLNSDIISLSWGAPDTGKNSLLPTIFNNPKTCYLASSGNNFNVAFPASIPNVLSIGATSVIMNSSNEIISEKPWVRSGSGISNSFTKPLYQPYMNINKRNKRMTPDIVALGDTATGALIVANKKLFSVGGTSLSCPIVAGMLSLAFQQRLNDNKRLLTSINNRPNSIQPLLYSQLNKNTCFNDIVRGYAGQHKAIPGFDLASGLGSFNCKKMVDYLSMID